MRVHLLQLGQALYGAPRHLVKAYYNHLSDALLAGITGLTAVGVAFVFLFLSGLRRIVGK